LKSLRQNKVLGIAIGEHSLMAAEVAMAGERAETRKLGEMAYPAGITPATPGALGKALSQFLKEQGFGAKSAVIGIPARWLVVKPKDVPPADPSTLADLLRLQAEGEFSSELKDLVYDYTADTQAGQVKTVLLIATARKYIDAAQELCEAARLNLLAVTPSVVALGAATARAVADDALVLAVGSGGAELTSQTGGVSSGIRHLRGPGPERSFVAELRRAVSTMPIPSGGTREMVLWGDAGVADDALGNSLGFKVRTGDLPVLGVATANTNGDGQKYAPAVALALSALADNDLPVDFLHSRLAPPKVHRIPRWAYIAALAFVALVAFSVYSYEDLQRQQADLDKAKAQLATQMPTIRDAEQFVQKVSFAQAWRGGNPRYLACLRDITDAIPDDKQTYVTNITVKENSREKTAGSAGSAGSASAGTAAAKGADAITLSGQLYLKTTDQKSAQAVVDRMRRNPAFIEAKPGPTSDVGRGSEVQSSINFTYLPPKLAQ
jgi:hypothetical protein